MNQENQDSRDLSRWQMIKKFQQETIESLTTAAEQIAEWAKEVGRNRRMILTLKSRVERLEKVNGLDWKPDRLPGRKPK